MLILNTIKAVLSGRLFVWYVLQEFVPGFDLGFNT